MSNKVSVIVPKDEVKVLRAKIALLQSRLSDENEDVPTVPLSTPIGYYPRWKVWTIVVIVVWAFFRFGT